MNKFSSLSLLTLLGLALPFGNIWGPLLMKVPFGSPERRFRTRLIRVETVMTFIAYIIAIAMLLVNKNGLTDPEQISTSLVVFLALDASIITFALGLAYMMKNGR